MLLRDAERMVRTMLAQKIDLAYIRHYLQEAYQLDDKTIDQAVAKVQPPKPKSSAQKPVKDEDKSKLRKQTFY
jgi:hypothetical protein